MQPKKKNEPSLRTIATAIKVETKKGVFSKYKPYLIYKLKSTYKIPQLGDALVQIDKPSGGQFEVHLCHDVSKNWKQGATLIVRGSDLVNPKERKKK